MPREQLVWPRQYLSKSLFQEETLDAGIHACSPSQSDAGNQGYEDACANTSYEHAPRLDALISEKAVPALLQEGSKTPRVDNAQRAVTTAHTVSEGSARTFCALGCQTNQFPY